MEVKAEATNGTPVAKVETQNPQGPNIQKKNNFQQNQQGGPNMQKKKNFQNRGGKMGGNQQGKMDRGPMRNEVIDEKIHPLQRVVAIFLGSIESDVDRN